MKLILLVTAIIMMVVIGIAFLCDDFPNDDGFNNY